MDSSTNFQESDPKTCTAENCEAAAKDLESDKFSSKKDCTVDKKQFIPILEDEDSNISIESGEYIV